ncbi:MAG: ABC transporter ATP-binding protein [Trueperaceae bacterium]
MAFDSERLACLAMLEFVNISKAYRTLTVLEAISLRIDEGSLTVLIGPSGSGKSTMLRLINRMIEPSSGQILLRGQDTTTLDPVTLRRGIGYVIQSIGLFPHMTVLENIAVVPSILGTPKARRLERAKELLELMGLEPQLYSTRYPKDLSGGQQQRVGIARALAANPELLLMDEPFSALDPITRETLQDEFAKIRKSLNQTIVFVTHDIDEAIKLADKVCLLNEGKIQQYDTPEAMLRQPANDFVASFLGKDRELKRLSRLSVRDMMRPYAGVSQNTGASQRAKTIPVSSTAKDALVHLLSHRGELFIGDDAGNILGVIALSDFVSDFGVQ